MRFRCTVNYRFNEYRFNVMSQFRIQNLMSKIKFHIKMSQFRVKSRFKESNCADEGHSLNREFTVQWMPHNVTISGRPFLVLISGWFY